MKVHPIDRAWLVLASMRTTAVLATAMALFAGLAAIIPQGREAMELVQFNHALDLRRLSAWGLTAVFDSAWIRALGVLLVANVMAVLISRLGQAVPNDVPMDAPAGAPHESELTTPLPERAVEALRVNFRAALGSAPAAERVEGAKVTMVFDTNRRGDLAPLLAHMGLILLVLGAGLLVEPPSMERSVVRANLKVADSRTGSVGYFDMAQGEPIKFFQWRTDYVIRDYVASRNGLGPAVRLEQIDPDQGRRSDFWVYRDAPVGFDRAHRRGLVTIEAISMGLQPAPGHGMSSNPASFLLLLGLALAVLGAAGSSRPLGRLWVEADGDRVKLVGVPQAAGDPAFAKNFGRLELLARAALGTT